MGLDCATCPTRDCGLGDHSPCSGETCVNSSLQDIFHPEGVMGDIRDETLEKGYPDESYRWHGLAGMRQLGAATASAPTQVVMGAATAADGQEGQSPGKVSAEKKPAKKPWSSAVRLRWGPRLEEIELMRQADWVLYCGCCGCGRSKECRPPDLSCTACCWQQMLSYERCNKDTEGGICSFVQSCCCLSAFCLLPLGERFPRCMVCSQPCCGITGGGRRNSTRETWPEYEANFEKYVPCYCCCLGCAAVPSLVPALASFMKCGCCLGKCKAAPCPDGLGAFALNCFCILVHCRMPPAYALNPVCALCGWRCKHNR